MPEFVVTDPKGKEYVITAPEGATQEDVIAYAQSQFAEKSEPAAMTKSAIETSGPHGTERGARIFEATRPYVGSGVASALGAGYDTAATVGEAVKKGAIPTIGAIGGLAAGTAAAPFAGPAAPAMPFIGEAGGSAIGELINQKLGITEPSGTEIALSAAAPGIGRVAAGGLRIAGGSLAKMFGGRQVIADQVAEVMAKRLSPPVPSDVLYEKLGKVNAFVPTFRTTRTVEDLIKDEAKKPMTAVSKTVREALAGYGQYFNTKQGIPTGHMSDISSTIKDLRFETSAAYKSGNSRLANTLTAIRNAILDDAEAVGVKEARLATKAARREFAVEDLGAIIRSAQPLKSFEDAISKTSKKGLQNSLLANSFDEAEKAEIKNVLKKLTTVAPSGFSGVWGRSMTGGLGGVLAGVPGAIAGALAPDYTAYALSTKAGRKFLEKLLVGNVWDAPRAAALATFVRGQMAEDAKNGNVAEVVKSTLKDKDSDINEKLKLAGMRAAMIGGAASIAQGVRR